jgi:hypothetical protein
MDLYTLQIFTPAAAPAQVPWVTYAAGLLTPVVAILGLCIAWKQWHTARMKLKLDLFDKRIVVYEAVRNAIGQTVVHGKTTQEVESAYLTGIAGARWLFNERMEKYLREEIWELFSELNYAQAEHEGAYLNEEKLIATQKKSAALSKFNEHFKNIDSEFAPFLSLGH